MTRWAAAIRAGRSAKNGATSASTPARVSVAHARFILAARLLDEDEPLPARRGQRLDRRRHDIGHDARALRAAGDEKAKLAVVESPDRASRAASSTAGRTGLPVECAFGRASAERPSSVGKPVAIALHARAQENVGAADHRVLLVQDARNASSAAASSGGTVG